MKDKMKYGELTVEELQNRLTEVSSELTSGRQKHRLGQFKKVSEFPRLRKEIARIKTHLRARETRTETEKKRA